VSGASAEGEVNHWPGFVDALTTIIMVVTFLLIILGATVFILSKKIVEQVRSEKVEDAIKNGQTSDVKTLTEQLDKARAEIAALKKSVSPIQSPQDADDGMSIADTDDFLRQDERVKGDARLSIRTRVTDNTKKLGAMSALQSCCWILILHQKRLITAQRQPLRSKPFWMASQMC
jgi:hypothetical protein